LNKIEAREVLRAQLQEWRAVTYPELCKKIGHSRRFETTGPSGTWYQGDVRVFWDDKPNGAIRVAGSIDDGGWRAFVPLTDSFILAPDGTFVGE
jgi:hypothetical protein